MHILSVSTSTIAAWHEDLITTGACGYAAVEWAVYAINRVNTGGGGTAGELLSWGKEKLDFFHLELRSWAGKTGKSPLSLPSLSPDGIEKH